MSQSEIDTLKAVLQRHWSGKPDAKVKQYVGQFFDRTRLGKRIAAQVEGNHGTYTVSIRVDEQGLHSACSCYIGKHGYCHHCAALAITFLNDPNSFQEIKTRPLAEVQGLAELTEYLQGVTLEVLLQELKAHGITQKAFADSIGMNSRHLSAVKSSELRNRFHYELGATKLACLWVLEHFGKNRTSS
jgi:uncharacterized Zn finger protein